MNDSFSTDPLMQCLVALTKLNHKPTSKAVLAHGLPFEPGKDKQRLFTADNPKANFSRAAQKAGFISKLQKRKLKDIPSLVLPVILNLKDDNACLLLEINHEEKTAQVIIPSLDDKPVQVTMEKLEQEYLGYAFFMKRKYEGFGQDQLGKKSTEPKHWFFSTLMKFKGIYGRVLLAAFLVNIFVIVGPVFTLNVYDRIIPHNAIDTLWVLAAGVALIYLFDVILKHIRTYFLENAARRSDVILSSMLFEQAMNLKLKNKPASVGSFSSIIKDFDSIRNFFASGVITAFIDLPFAWIFLLVIYYINNIIVLIPLTAILLILLLSIPMRHAAQKIIDTTHEATHKRNSILVEALANLETVKTFNAGSSMQWHWEESIGSIAEKTQRSRVRIGSLSTLTGFLTQCSSVAIIVAGVYLIRERELTMGGLIAINILASRSISPMAQAISLLMNFGQMKTGLKSLNEFMERETERPEHKKFLHRPTLKGEIEFTDVDFNYPEEDNKAVSNISFHIKTGERVGIIGAVGSGKSTIGKLLLGLFEPAKGSIFIDGLDIKQIDPVDLRNNFNYVPQDVVLFSGTVRDNITLRSPHAEDNAIINAAKIGRVDAFTNRHPRGMDLQVGERGFGLSGGQRQSVAVAMAFIEQSPIILLDEPTNSMDFNTENQVISNLNKITRDKTTLVITHKPSILKIVDRLLVMDKGRLVMDGPREEVIAKLGGKTQ
ncbi:MAG: type I secretion system permease/ATPase [Desulfobacteraceae bacterium]